MKVIIVRYSEIFLKGNNKNYFESVLIDNIRTQLKDFHCQVRKFRSRYVVFDFEQENCQAIVDAVKCVFGVYSVSVADEIDTSFDTIKQKCIEIAPQKGTFKVIANRADKTFPMNSMTLAGEIGHALLVSNNQLKVDIHNPENIVYIDVRENGKTFVYSNVEKAVNGMPVGTAGKGLALLSGGIDSPVAVFMMAKRGMRIRCLHFESFPFTSLQAKEKVLTLAKILKKYTMKISVDVVNIAEIQTEIHDKCDESFMIAIMRRFMMRIATIIAKKHGCGAVITGESLGQVASQTLESLTSTSAVCALPIFRPLIGFDKDEIVAISKRIGAFETSIQPFEDCCTIFLPKSPVIRPRLDVVEKMEEALDVDALVQRAIESFETFEIE